MTSTAMATSTCDSTGPASACRPTLWRKLRESSRVEGLGAYVFSFFFSFFGGVE